MIRFALALMLVSFATLAQSQDRSVKKPETPSALTQLAEKKREIVETKEQIKKLEAHLEKLKIEAEALEAESQKPAAVIAEEKAFNESQPQLILDIAESNALLVDFQGDQKWIALHGVKPKPLFAKQLVGYLKQNFLKKNLYVRCVDSSCKYAYFYENQNKDSLNVKVLLAGYVEVQEDAMFDLRRFAPIVPSRAFSSVTSDAGSTSSKPASGSRSSDRTPVYIRGPKGGCYYINSEGNKTYVDQSLCK